MPRAYSGNRCIIPNCNAGYVSNLQENKCHTFGVPSDENLLLEWKKAIPRKDYVLKSGMRVCSKHFHPEDILWSHDVLDPAGNVMASEKYKVPLLKKGAVPSQFPNCPSYLSKTVRKRKSPKGRISCVEPKKSRAKNEILKTKQEMEIPNSHEDSIPPREEMIPMEVPNSHEDSIPREDTIHQEVPHPPEDPVIAQRRNLFDSLFRKEKIVRSPEAFII